MSKSEWLLRNNQLPWLRMDDRLIVLYCFTSCGQAYERCVDRRREKREIADGSSREPSRKVYRNCWSRRSVNDSPCLGRCPMTGELQMKRCWPRKQAEIPGEGVLERQGRSKHAQTRLELLGKSKTAKQSKHCSMWGLLCHLNHQAVEWTYLIVDVLS